MMLRASPASRAQVPDEVPEQSFLSYPKQKPIQSMNKSKSIQDLLFVIMRVTLTQVLAMVAMTTLAFAADINGQGILERKVSISVENQEITFVLAAIEKQAAVNFTYRSSLVKPLDKVSLHVKDVTIGDVLERLFSPAIDFTVVREEIVLQANTEITALTEQKQTVVPYAITISGRITDEQNNGLPGVNVLEKGTTNGTTTDVNGGYTLSVENENSILVFSFIGYSPKETTVGSQVSIDIALDPDIQSLQEVVVIGYGEQKKANYTGAVSSVNSKEIVQAPVANVTNALAGRMTGLITYQRNGEPGQDGTTLLIRGMSTSGNSNPLAVVDGIPRDFSQLDPNEIESITLLKDAASAAVYGVRGSNGVILVTTKRGKLGIPQLSFNVRFDAQKPTVLPKFMNSYDYAMLRNEAAVNSKETSIPFTQADLDGYKNGTDKNAYPDTDWVKETLSEYAPQQQYNISLSGGTEKARYFISGGLVNQDGLYAQSNFKRYNFRSNIDVDATPTTRISADISGRLEKRDAPTLAANQTLYNALYLPPTVAAYYNNPNPTPELPAILPGGQLGRHPVERVKQGGYNNRTNNVLQTRFVLDQKLPVEGLSLKGVFAFDKGNYGYKTLETPFQVYEYNKVTKGFTPFKNGDISNIRLSEEMGQSDELTLETHLNYKRTIGKHETNATLVYTQTEGKSNLMWAQRDNLPSESVPELFTGDPKAQKNDGRSFSWGRRGVVGRVGYIFDGKYLFEANGRYDGSYNFAPGQKYGFFPSISAGWKISEENFFQAAFSSMEYLKLRASYGTGANDQVGAYEYLATYSFGEGYVFGPNVLNGLDSDGIADPSTTWETSKTIDIGLEGSAWNKLIGFEVGVFHKVTSDILGYRNLAIPQTLGESLPLENINEVKNEGFEFKLTHDNTIKVSTGINYFVNANFTYAKNELTYADEPITKNPNLKEVGKSLFQYFGYRATGLFQTEAEIDAAPGQFGDNNDNLSPGDIKYADISGRDADGNFTGAPDGKINEDDMVAIGYSPIPQIVYGIAGGASFKGLDLSFLFQGTEKVSTWLQGEVAWPFLNGAKALEAHKDHWTETNTDAAYPRVTSAPTDNNKRQSSFWLEDASYLRLKNVTLGYSLPTNLLSKAKIKYARIYISGQNLITFTKLKEVDPEGPGASGNSFNSQANGGWFYPQQKVFSAGVNLTF